jgi:hypothetical protein
MAAGLLSAKLKLKVSGALVLESCIPTRIAEALAIVEQELEPSVT